MILPIYAYGCPVLRKRGEDISADYPNLKEIIDNMYETMYKSSGIGLAAPQVGLSIRLFIIDGSPIEDINPPGFKQTFINPQIIKEWGEEWKYEEGCLSIPTIRENVSRKPELTIRFWTKTLWNMKKRMTAWQPESFNMNTTTLKANYLLTIFRL
jgi:peptide deformylase